MLVSDVEKQVLRLLDEVSVTDYAERMYRMIDEAQREIATTWGFIRRACTLEVTAGEPTELPANFYAMEKADREDFEIVPMEVGGQWKNGIIFSEGGTVRILYKAYPTEVTESDAAMEIELAPEYHTALCCYVAALTQHNEYDKRAYQIFMERYNNSIASVQHAKQMTGKARVVNYGRII
ncbi:MAG: hypothetical protein IKM48_08715 [Clostridia bacterium]|nr:hypothetical protein [Clostridia bacterium]